MTTLAFRLYLAFVFVVIFLAFLLVQSMIGGVSGWLFFGLIALLSGLVTLWLVVEP
jgi:hypothetical protein